LVAVLDAVRFISNVVIAVVDRKVTSKSDWDQWVLKLAESSTRAQIANQQR
jgi:hypothetical protein